MRCKSDLELDYEAAYWVALDATRPTNSCNNPAVIPAGLVGSRLSSGWS
jgi:hypothetical protein